MENEVYRIDESTTPPTMTKIQGIVSGSFHYSARAGCSDEPRIGGVYGSYIEFDYFTPNAVSLSVGDRVDYYQRVDVDEDFNPIVNSRHFLINSFIVKNITTGSKKNRVIAYDCAEKLDVNYSQRLKAIENNFPMTIADLISDVMSFTGLTTNMTANSAPWVKGIVINYFYADGITARDIINYAAEIYGMICRSETATSNYIFCGSFFVGRTGTPWGSINDSVITPDDGDYTSVANAYKDIWYKENGLAQSNPPAKYDGVKITSSDGTGIAYYADSQNPANLYYITNNVLIDNINSLPNSYTYDDLAQYIFTELKTVFLYNSYYDTSKVSTVKLFPFRMPFSAGDVVKIINPDGTLSRFPIISLDLTESEVTLEGLGSTDTYYQSDLGGSNYEKTIEVIASQVNRLSKPHYVDKTVTLNANSNVSPFSAYGYADASSDLPSGCIYTGAVVIDNASTNPAVATVTLTGSLFVYARSAATLTVRLTYQDL